MPLVPSAPGGIDEGNHLLVGVYAGRNPNNKREAEPALADTGKFNRENVESRESAGIET